MNIIKELLKGNLEIFEDMTLPEVYDTFEKVKVSHYKNKILKQILPRFYIDAYKYGISEEVFNLIYLNKKYNKYTFYLLHKEYVKAERLDKEQVKNILYKTKWGFNYICDNLENILSGLFTLNKTQTILEYCEKNKDKFKTVLEKVYQIEDFEIKENFLISSYLRKLATKEDLIKAIYKNIDDFYYKQESFINEETEYNSSRIPEVFIKQDYDKELVKYRDLLIESSGSRKMAIINYFSKNIANLDLFDKYGELIRFYKTYPNANTDKIMSIIFNHHKEEELSNYIKGKLLMKLPTGSTSTPFRVGNEVVKFSFKKHDLKVVPDIFLIAPTETYKLMNKNGGCELIIEKQPYLDIKHEDIKMTKEDVGLWLKELDSLGYETTDPHNLNITFENFGFLNDYHEARLGNFKSHEDLPEWFKKKPIVLFDIDLIYRKDDKTKRYFKTI